MTVAALTTKATLTESLRANLSVINVLTESHRSVRDIIWHLQPCRQIIRWPVCSRELGFIKYRCNFSFCFFHIPSSFRICCYCHHNAYVCLVQISFKSPPLPRCSRIVLICFFARTLNTLRKSIFFKPCCEFKLTLCIRFFVCMCVRV